MVERPLGADDSLEDLEGVKDRERRPAGVDDRRPTVDDDTTLETEPTP